MPHGKGVANGLSEVHFSKGQPVGIATASVLVNGTELVIKMSTDEINGRLLFGDDNELMINKFNNIGIKKDFSFPDGSTFNGTVFSDEYIEGTMQRANGNRYEG